MESFMEIAIKEAISGVKQKHGGPFGAVIVYKDKIISQAHNEVILKNDPTCHAEILAIRRASKAINNFNLHGCSIFTTCEPCPMCLSAILWAKITKVYFGCTKIDAEEIGFNDNLYFNIIKNTNSQNNNSQNTHLKLDMSNFYRKKCLEIFKTWNKLDDKTIY